MIIIKLYITSMLISSLWMVVGSGVAIRLGEWFYIWTFAPMMILLGLGAIIMIPSMFWAVLRMTWND